MLWYYFFYVSIFFIAWALSFPRQAMAITGNLKQQLAHFVIQQLIAKDMHLLKSRFRKWGKFNGYQQQLIDEVLDEHTAKIVQRLEARYSPANSDEWFQEKN
jgi:hypothetical protein